MHSLTYNNVIYYIKKNYMEATTHFWERAWFIVKNAKESKIDQELINYSNLWSAYKFNGCVYEDDIMKIIIDMEKNLYYHQL